VSHSRKMTMAELAKLARVDVSTVSRALNNSPLVKNDTKIEILRMAAEVGYVVNASARNLRRRSSEAIGMVIPLRPESGQTLSDPFFLEIVGAVSQAASTRGYDLIISVPKEEEKIAGQRLLQTGRADGLIVIGQAGRLHRLDALGDLSSKIVVWGGSDSHANYTIVGSNNLEGGRLAANHLLSLGRRRIAFVGPIALPEVKLRFDGFVSAHERYNVPVNPALSLNVEFGADTAYSDIINFLESGETFDAIFAASDVLAMKAILALQSKGIVVPEDIAVIGYDNIGQSALSTPPLTTIDQSIGLGGAMLVDALLRKLEGEVVLSQMTPTQLVIRGSTVTDHIQYSAQGAGSRTHLRSGRDSQN
jgi:DNA-binding LacI/PurR family transcriptional regulator